MPSPKPNHFANQMGGKKMTRSNGREYHIRDNRDRFFFPYEWAHFYDALDK